MEDNFFRKAEQDKKDLIKNLLKSGYGVQQVKEPNHNNIPGLSELDKIALQNKLELDNKLREFSSFSYKNYQGYTNSVLTPAQMKIKIQEEMTKQEEQQQLKNAQAKEVKRDYDHQHQRILNRVGVQSQIKDHTLSKKLQEQNELEASMRQSMLEEMKYKKDCQDEEERKKEQMALYKKHLDEQVNMKKKFEMYGNMSGVEKNLNRNELLAYKNYDHHNVAMIPGFNSSPHQPSQRVLFDKMQQNMKKPQMDELNQLNKLGFTRE